MSGSIITQIADFVRQDMEGVCSAHDFFHIQRVVGNAERIIAATHSDIQINTLVIIASAYLHEYFDEKFWDVNDSEKRELTLMQFLSDLGVESDDRDQIMHIIHNVGYGKSLIRGHDFSYSIEFMIVEDADRLDAIGAIAIARTFAYGGKKGRPIYDPAIKAQTLSSDSQYRLSSEENTSLNHFWEKLLLLKDLMHTDAGKVFATQRHDYMQGFLDQFLNEWDGRA